MSSITITPVSESTVSSMESVASTPLQFAMSQLPKLSSNELVKLADAIAIIQQTSTLTTAIQTAVNDQLLEADSHLHRFLAKMRIRSIIPNYSIELEFDSVTSSGTSIVHRFSLQYETDQRVDEMGSSISYYELVLLESETGTVLFSSIYQFEQGPRHCEAHTQQVCQIKLPLVTWLCQHGVPCMNEDEVDWCVPTIIRLLFTVLVRAFNLFAEDPETILGHLLGSVNV